LFDQTVPSAYAAVAGEEAGVLEGEEDMLKELERDMLFLGNVSAEQGGSTMMVGEFD
jgi:isopentenyl diphosphate isomerase/L-lactate dehydrogenase-like FMN-dependent dehydrogenase